MFGLIGVAEAIALVIIGGISAPLFVRPSRRGSPVLIARRFSVDTCRWAAVSIEGRQTGLITRLLALAGIDVKTTLEVTKELITYHRGGIWHRERAAIPVMHVTSARCLTTQPLWHLSAVGVIAIILSVAAAGDRLTVQEFGAGLILAGACGVLCALQRTTQLIIEGGKTRIELTFSAIGVRKGVTMEDVMRAADRITELALMRQRLQLVSPGGLCKSEVEKSEVCLHLESGGS